VRIVVLALIVRLNVVVAGAGVKPPRVRVKAPLLLTLVSGVASVVVFSKLSDADVVRLNVEELVNVPASTVNPILSRVPVPKLTAPLTYKVPGYVELLFAKGVALALLRVNELVEVTTNLVLASERELRVKFPTPSVLLAAVALLILLNEYKSPYVAVVCLIYKSPPPPLWYVPLPPFMITCDAAILLLVV
jgi:hypothetical protein